MPDDGLGGTLSFASQRCLHLIVSDLRRLKNDFEKDEVTHQKFHLNDDLLSRM